ncbi:MAG TPA: tyrosine-type recombinase/integrase [Marmoricola sp.]|nr:tyrosine-type recombinase/integrase [Marmoricola sp.]
MVTTETGKPLRNSNWSPIWRDAVERALIGHARPYDLRHPFASWMLQDGVPLAEVGALLGRVSTQTTQVYAHLAQEPSERVRSALAAHESPTGRRVNKLPER